MLKKLIVVLIFASSLVINFIHTRLTGNIPGNIQKDISEIGHSPLLIAAPDCGNRTDHIKKNANA